MVLSFSRQHELIYSNDKILTMDILKSQCLYSLLYYINVVLTNFIYFKGMFPTNHYLEEHEKDVPWDKVVEIILTTKNPRKLGNKFVIEKDSYYVLFEVKNQILFVINAKKSK